MQETNLLDLIQKDEQTISGYLGDVDTQQFVRDVQSLLKNSTEKQIIEQAIEKLQALL